MNYSNLRNFWYLVEKTNSSSLLNLSDMDLVNHLLRQLENQQLLNLEENDITSDYIYSKITLIRDLADSRLISSV
ncbi:MAG: hypothetical protein AB4038_19085 [Prochloraceae cyanobacterium]